MTEQENEKVKELVDNEICCSMGEARRIVFAMKDSKKCRKVIEQRLKVAKEQR